MAALSAVAFIPMVGSVLAKGSKVAVKAARATAKLSSQYVQSAVKALSYTATIGKKADAISDVGRGLKKGLKSSVDDVVQKAATKTTKSAKVASKAADGAVASGQSFRKLDLQFFANKSGTNTGNPVIDNMQNRVPNNEVTPPNKRGNAPISNKDGKPIEIHHKDQEPLGPFDEMHPSDHRYGENYKKNHPNYNGKSKVDRTQFREWKREYWEQEWDNGRWND